MQLTNSAVIGQIYSGTLFSAIDPFFPPSTPRAKDFSPSAFSFSFRASGASAFPRRSTSVFSKMSFAWALHLKQLYPFVLSGSKTSDNDVFFHHRLFREVWTVYSSLTHRPLKASIRGPPTALKWKVFHWGPFVLFQQLLRRNSWLSSFLDCWVFCKFSSPRLRHLL